MIQIKRVSECPLNDATIAWNKGFEGYYFDMNTTVEQFTRRMVLEGLSPTLSVLVYDDNEPIGIILNGVRMIEGKKISWNGGTGIAEEYRGTGIGKALMEAVDLIYQEEGVHIATLEAISQNTKAIKLYEKMGYKVVDEMVHLQHSGPIEKKIARKKEVVIFKKGIPIDVIDLPFYQPMTSWQTQWSNARDGESIVAVDQNNEQVGYAIYKRIFNVETKLVSIVLLQCEAAPSINHSEAVIRGLLSTVFESDECDISRTVANLSKSNDIVYRVLMEAGFKLKVEQVWMSKQVEKRG